MAWPSMARLARKLPDQEDATWTSVPEAFAPPLDVRASL